jgi:ribosomal-protein-alanine N-acetyltransferase
MMISAPGRVRDAVKEDLGAIVAIERMAFSDPWSQAMFRAHFDTAGGNVFLVADDENGVAGYAVAQAVSDESELLNIAVDQVRRNRGIGALLLEAVMERCRDAGALDMWLEVRASNAGAHALYGRYGFVQVGVRKRYYHAPREDAIVLRAGLRLSSSNESVTNPVSGFTAERVDSILSRASHFPRQETK